LRNFGPQLLVSLLEVVFTKNCGFVVFLLIKEIDLCWRTLNKDIKSNINTESIVYHVGGATLQQGNQKKTFEFSKLFVNVI
jgi:GT2 family glycosyltransferase